MKVLFTGSRGYIGLRATQVLRSLFPGYEITEVDLQLGSDYSKVTGEWDVIIHSGAYTSVTASEQHKAEYIFNNVCKAQELIMNTVSKKFIFFSTVEVYNENRELNPKSVYGATKAVIEEELLNRSGTRHENKYVIRIANPVGLYDCHKDYVHKLNDENATVFNLLAKMYIKEGTFLIHDDLQMTRDFFPLDIIPAFISRLIMDTPEPGVYNLGSGIQTQVTPLLESLCRKAGIKYKFIPRPESRYYIKRKEVSCHL